MKAARDEEKALRELAIDLLGHASDANKKLTMWREPRNRDADDNTLSGAATDTYSSPIASVVTSEWSMDGTHTPMRSWERGERGGAARPLSPTVPRPHTSQGFHERPRSAQAVNRPGSAMSGGGSRPGSASHARRGRNLPTTPPAMLEVHDLQTPEQPQRRRRRRRIPMRAMREAGRDDPICKGVSLSPLHDMLLGGTAWEEEGASRNVSPERSYTWYPMRKVDSRRRIKAHTPGPADYTPRWVANPGASWPHGRTTRVLGRTNRRFRPTYAEIEASLTPSPAAYQKLAEAGSTRAAMRYTSIHKGVPSAFFGTSEHPQEDLFLSEDGLSLYY